MTLYLVRHGVALPDSINPKAPLSPVGRAEVEKVARFLSKQKIALDLIYHSSKLRAQETAEILSKTLKCELHELALKPSDPVEPIAYLLNGSTESLMLVSHQPFLSRLVSYLLIGGEREMVEFQSASVVCLERTGTLWKLIWHITPELVGA